MTVCQNNLWYVDCFYIVWVFFNLRTFPVLRCKLGNAFERKGLENPFQLKANFSVPVAKHIAKAANININIFIFALYCDIRLIMCYFSNPTKATILVVLPYRVNNKGSIKSFIQVSAWKVSCEITFNYVCMMHSADDYNIYAHKICNLTVSK